MEISQSTIVGALGGHGARKVKAHRAGRDKKLKQGRGIQKVLALIITTATMHTVPVTVVKRVLFVQSGTTGAVRVTNQGRGTSLAATTQMHRVTKTISCTI